MAKVTIGERPSDGVIGWKPRRCTPLCKRRSKRLAMRLERLHAKLQDVIQRVSQACRRRVRDGAHLEVPTSPIPMQSSPPLPRPAGRAAGTCGSPSARCCRIRTAGRVCPEQVLADRREPDSYVAHQPPGLEYGRKSSHWANVDWNCAYRLHGVGVDLGSLRVSQAAERFQVGLKAAGSSTPATPRPASCCGRSACRDRAGQCATP